MSLIRLDVSDFRNISSLQFEPISNGFNLIYGNNGSGKTSLLESIYYLSFGRSFRSANIEHIVRKSATQFSLFTNLLTQNDHHVPIGLERDQNGSLKVRVNGKDISSVAELANLLPVQLINSHCYDLLESGPIFRRKYIDWGAFHLNSDFFRVWKQYKRLLKQRNAALVSSVSRKEILMWSEQLVECALQLDQWRQSYIDCLVPILKNHLGNLLSITSLDVAYQSGWKNGMKYQDCLLESLPRDMQLGYTQFGPHRADLRVMISGLPAKDILSRGQQKLFVCAMIVAQGELLYNKLNKKLIYLVDDLPSELDLKSRSSLITLLSKQEAQVFVTAVERDVFSHCPTNKPVRMFHVEHGKLCAAID